jgi:dolichyl-phosphate beta-glucosyltransferase
LRQPELSIVIPVYNEEARLGKTLEGAFRYLKKERISSEVVVVDDGSKDKTLQVAEKFKKLGTTRQSLRILKHKINRGKGAAVQTGALAAKGQFVLYMDADNSTPLSEFEKFRPAITQGVEVLVGSRAVDRSQVKVHQPFYRELMGRVFNLFVQTLAIPGLWDTQCGFKAFSRKAAREIFPLQTIERFGFDVELLYLAKKKGFKISEISVQWFDSPYSKVDVFQDSFTMLTDLIVIRLNDMKGLYASKKPS